MTKIKNRNVINEENIKLDSIIFVDFKLICLKDKTEVWNTFVTNVFFFGIENELFYGAVILLGHGIVRNVFDILDCVGIDLVFGSFIYRDYLKHLGFPLYF